MIEINNLTRSRIDKVFLKKIADRVLKKEKRNKLELSIALVDSKRIKALNNKYRNKKQPTDVLSFSYRTLRSGARWKMKQGLIAHEDWGEIVICPQQVRKNAKKYKSDFEKELAHVLIHGILHLLGYNHKTMGKKQNYYQKVWQRSKI